MAKQNVCLYTYRVNLNKFLKIVLNRFRCGKLIEFRWISNFGEKIHQDIRELSKNFVCTLVMKMCSMSKCQHFHRFDLNTHKKKLHIAHALSSAPRLPCTIATSKHTCMLALSRLIVIFNGNEKSSNVNFYSFDHNEHYLSAAVLS